MGKTRGLYNAEFPRGAWVQIAGRAELERFANNWNYHHPLEKKQFEFAGTVSRVEDLGYYHGGTEIYELKNVPGVWHEVCLMKAKQPRKPRRPQTKKAPVRVKKKAPVRVKRSVKRKKKPVTKPKKSRKR